MGHDRAADRGHHGGSIDRDSTIATKTKLQLEAIDSVCTGTATTTMGRGSIRTSSGTGTIASIEEGGTPGGGFHRINGEGEGEPVTGQMMMMIIEEDVAA